MIYFISIGNSDDKLTQSEWSNLCDQVNRLAHASTTRSKMHGAWFSLPNDEWQNACWCVEFDPNLPVVTRDGQQKPLLQHVEDRLTEFAREFQQKSIFFAQAEPKFITP
jgi:hypothetical protein